MTSLLSSIVAHRWFTRTVLWAIVLAGVLAGLETSPAIMEVAGPWLVTLDRVILAIFSIEALLKILSHGKRPWRYLKDPWNVFDALVLLACLLPALGAHGAVLRLFRLLRVLRLVRALPGLRLLVEALLKALPSMGWVGLLLSLFVYVYAVAGVHLFGANDPLHFGSLGKALLTLFAVVTMEGWTDIMNIQRFGCATQYVSEFQGLCTNSRAWPMLAPAYFLTFILMGTMIILNLVIGVIVGALEEARNVDGDPKPEPVETRLDRIEKNLALLLERQTEKRDVSP